MIRYYLDEVWTDCKEHIVEAIKNTYHDTTGSDITDQEAQAIEQLLYNGTAHLRHCYIVHNYDNEVDIKKFQMLFIDTIKSHTYALVTEWKSIYTLLNPKAGIDILENSFYDVADTPYTQTKQFNELDIAFKQLDYMYTHTNAFKAFYKDLKFLVQTLY